MTLYSGDELYDDDTTSGPATDEGFPVTIITADGIGYGILTPDDRIVPFCDRHYVRLDRGLCPDCVTLLESPEDPA